MVPTPAVKTTCSGYTCQDKLNCEVTGLITLGHLRCGKSVILSGMRITEKQLRNLVRKQLKEAGEKKLLGIPQYWQETKSGCGAAAIRQILMYFGVDKPEIAIRAQVGTTPGNGTEYYDLVSWINETGWLQAEPRSLTSDDLKNYIDRGFPVIIDLQAYAKKKIDYSKDLDDGHYVVLNGYDDDNFYFSDSATKHPQTYLPIEELEPRWHDKTGEGKIMNKLGIVVHQVAPAPASKQGPSTQPVTKVFGGAKAKAKKLG